MTRYALLIGTTHYQDALFSKLTAPASDVHELHAVLTEPNIGGFSAPPPLVDRPASELTLELENFFEARRRSELLLLYFSGHGVVDDHGRLYLVATNTNRKRLRSTAILASFVRELMDGCRSESQVLILDCCHSGAFGRTKGALGTSVGTEAAFGGAGRIVLAASDATQFAFEGNQLVADATTSLFTHFLLQGLRSGDADLDGDGSISVDELYEYAHAQMSAVTTTQTPNKWVFGQRGNLLIARNPKPRMRPDLLAPDLLQALDSRERWIKKAAIERLAELMCEPHPGLALAARGKLEELVSHDSRFVADTAAQCLALASPVTQPPQTSVLSSAGTQGTPAAESTAVAEVPSIIISSTLATDADTLATPNARPPVDEAAREGMTRVAADDAPPPRIEQPLRPMDVEPVAPLPTPADTFKPKSTSSAARSLSAFAAITAIGLIALILSRQGDRTQTEFSAAAATVGPLAVTPSPKPPERSQPEPQQTHPREVEVPFVDLEGVGSGWVRSAAFSPDMQSIVTAGSDRTARIRRIDASGQPIVLRGHTGEVTSAEFNRAGTRVLTSSYDDTARVWNADGSGEALVLQHPNWVRSAVFSADGNHVLTACSDDNARVWSLDGKSAVLLNVSGIRAAAFSPTNERVYVAANNGSVQTCNIDGSDCRTILPPNDEDCMNKFAISPDGTRIATACDELVRVWNADGSGGARVLRGHVRGAESLAFSPDSRRLAVAVAAEMTLVWNLAGGSTSRPLILPQAVNAPGLLTTVYSAAFSADGDRIVTASQDGLVRLWKADGSGKPVELSPGHEADTSSISFSVDGTRLATTTCDWDTSIYFWSATGSRIGAPLGGFGRRHVCGAWFNRDATRVLAQTDSERFVRIMRTDGSGQPGFLHGHSGGISSIALNQDHTRAVTTSYDNTARVWRTDGSLNSVLLRGHKKYVNEAAFSRDGTRIVTASGDGTARVWNVDGSGQPVILRGHPGGVASAAFSPDGSRIATVSEDTVRVWNADGSGEPLVMREGDGSIRHVAYSPDGRQLLTTVLAIARSGAARLWSADGSASTLLWRIDDDTTPEAGFSPDGRRIFVAADNVVRVYRMDDLGNPLILHHPQEVTLAVFSPDGQRLVVGGAPARMWILPRLD